MKSCDYEIKDCKYYCAKYDENGNEQRNWCDYDGKGCVKDEGGEE